MKTQVPTEFCDPLGDYNSPQTIAESFMYLGILTFVLFVLAYLSILYQAKNFE